MITLDHTPGEPFSELDAARPGWAVVRTREASGAVHELARCHSHDAPLIKRARELPHECGHDGCPGRATAAKIAEIDAIKAKAGAVVDAFWAFQYADLAQAIGETRARALWDRVTALEAALGGR